MAQSFVIYNKATTEIITERAYSKKYYASEAAAKAALTRFVKKGVCVRDEVAITDIEDFNNNVEKYEMVTNFMTGQLVRQRVNTPRCCDVSSELYWAM